MIKHHELFCPILSTGRAFPLFSFLCCLLAGDVQNTTTFVVLGGVKSKVKIKIT